MATDRPRSREVPPGYVIVGGRVDADCLGRQADVMATAMTALLSRTELRVGWACLDLGCGTGQMTVELARTVGRAGRVVGVDHDREALECGRSGGVARAVRVRRRPRPAGAARGLDLGYARLLLSHLTEPVTALRQLRAVVARAAWSPWRIYSPARGAFTEDTLIWPLR